MIQTGAQGHDLCRSHRGTSLAVPHSKDQPCSEAFIRISQSVRLIQRIL